MGIAEDALRRIVDVAQSGDANALTNIEGLAIQALEALDAQSWAKEAHQRWQSGAALPRMDQGTALSSVRRLLRR